jgi:hypothetical protein
MADERWPSVVIDDTEADHRFGVRSAGDRIGGYPRMVSVRVCPRCSALVADQDHHERWHGSPSVAPD